MLETSIILGNDCDNQNWNDENRFNGTYLHGEIATDKGYDIFCFTEKLELGEGIHNIKVDDRECAFFLWESKLRGYVEWRGLLIYSTDPEYDYCYTKFIEKSITL